MEKCELGNKTGKLSIIYTFANLLRQGISFLLLPLLTRLLNPFDYGVISTVGSITQILSILFTLSVQSAIFRYYFDHKDNEEELKVFFGTAITFIFINSCLFSFIFLFCGKYIFKLILNEIPFFPYVVIGILTLIFLPFTEIYFSILQANQQAKKYSYYSILRTFITLIFNLVLIIGFNLKAEGMLLGTLISALFFFIFSLYEMRKYIKIGINRSYLKKILKYSLPIIPHNVSGCIKGLTDKYFLNQMVGTMFVGYYFLGAKFALLIGIITESFSKSIKPDFFKALKDNDKLKISSIIKITKIYSYVLCMIALIMSVFSFEIITLFASTNFIESYRILPFLVFNGVLQGFYVYLVIPLVFDQKTVKYVSIITIFGLILNIFFTFIGIRYFGYIGSALSTLFTKYISTLLIYVIQKKIINIDFCFFEINLIFIVTFIVSVTCVFNSWFSSFSIIVLTSKLSLILMLNFFLDLFYWKSPWWSFRYLKNCIIKTYISYGKKL